MTKNITNLSNAVSLRDPRYGTVFTMNLPGAVPLHKIDLAIAAIDPHATSPNHFHERTEEAYFVTEGEGIMTIQGVSTPIKPGDLVRIPTWTTHSVHAGSGGLRFIVVTSPPYTEGDDIETDAVTVDKRVIDARTRESAPTIAVIIGTHRPGSVSAKVARQIVGMYTELGVNTDLIDPADLPLELFHPESYERRYDTDSPLAQRIIAAHGLFAVVPEYNGSVPGVLKHILDIMPYKQCFEGKPVAMVGIAAGDFGGARALDQLGAIFGYRSANLFGKRVLVKNVDEAPVDENGHLTDPEIVDRLRAQVRGFADFVFRLSA